MALGWCRSAQALAAAEAEHAAAERRQELFVLFRNAAKVFPEEGYAVVGPRLQALASKEDTDFKVIHSALYCKVWCSHLPEGLRQPRHSWRHQGHACAISLCSACDTSARQWRGVGKGGDACRTQS